uniref:Phytosulfokine n=1 Tax=Zea mays TaxID=4577 RepID=B6SY62_MAIZE|nr:phytosulfokines 5 precursor [Zea mays]
MMRRCSIAALAIFLLLLVCSSSSSNCAAAARLLPGAGHLRPLRHAAVGASGDELSAGSETMEACEEGNGKDECVQRRLLLDAHLDYIYTQHKGKP